MTKLGPIVTALLLSITACKDTVSVQGDGETSSGSGSGGNAGSTSSGGICAVSACSDLDWANWPIPSAPGEGKPNPVSYELGDGVAVDSVTGLMWQRDAAPGTYTLEMAKAYCTSSAVAGFSDWRLPTRIELVSIVDDTAVNPAINATVFPDTPEDYTWTSTPLFVDSAGVWSVHFAGYEYYSNAADTSNQQPARCVRGGVAAPSCRYSATDTTVLDTATKLTWQRNVDPGQYTWADAKAYCDTLTLDGGGWRLPAVKELLSLIDLCRTYPVVNPEVFPDTPAELFWSGTLVAGGPANAWFVYFGEGNADSHEVSTLSFARCVR